MTTKGEILKEKYLALEADLKQYVSVGLLPSLDTLDLADVTFLLANMFIGIETDEQYNAKILELIELNGVTIEDKKIELNGVSIDKKNLDIVVKLLTDFLRFFKSL